MNTRPVRLSLLAVLLAVLLPACTPNGGDIYYILENEQKQPPSNLGSTITGADVARLGSSYYAAAGTIFQGVLETNGTVTWVTDGKTTPLAPPVSGALCNALAAFQGNLYGGFLTTSSNLGLYKASGADFTSAGAHITDAGVSGSQQQITRLIVAGGQLLIIVATPAVDPTTKTQPFTYSLVATADGVSFTVLMTNIPVSINDASFDGTTYYAVTSNDATVSPNVPPVLYKGTLSGLQPDSNFPTLAATDSLQGVYCDGGAVYVSSKASGIYVLRTGTWTPIAPDTQSGNTVSYFGISGPVAGPSGPLYLIGSDGYGYYSLSKNDNTIARSADTTMITLALYTASIKKLVVDGTLSPANVFACTVNGGLWKGVVDSTNPSGVFVWKVQ
jgi:hypothetical protein